MARPPRVPVLLPWEFEVSYFLTLCVTPRKNVLANDIVWNAINSTLGRLDQWKLLCGVVMPDHVHLITMPIDRELSVAAFLKWFKRWFNESCEHKTVWNWQEGGFDRLLRSSESVTEKWVYIRENPVRSGLVHIWNDWPYQLGLLQGEPEDTHPSD